MHSKQSTLKGLHLDPDSRSPSSSSPLLPYLPQFLHKELPVRLAHRVAELENLPYGLSTKSGVLKVQYNSYGILTLVPTATLTPHQSIYFHTFRSETGTLNLLKSCVPLARSRTRRMSRGSQSCSDPSIRDMRALCR